MTRADLILLVQSRMDEATPFSANELVASTNVGSFLDKAADELLMKVPLKLITPVAMTGTVVTNPSDGTGTIPVPADYLRLHSLKLAEWSEAVTDTITEQDPRYKLQKFRTTRGKPSKPVVVEMTSGTLRVLKYYSVITSHIITYKTYVQSLGANFTTFPDNLSSAMAYQVAGNIYLSQGMANEANGMYSKVTEFIQSNQ